MKIKLCLTLFILQFSCLSVANDLNVEEIERGGKSIKVLVNLYWQGEYPAPVLNIQYGKRGYTKISGYPTYKKLKKKSECLVSNGLYHQWAEKKKADGFVTLQAVEEYTFHNVYDIDVPNYIYSDPKIVLEVGDKLVGTSHMQEDMCRGYLQREGRKKSKEIRFYCDLLVQKNHLKQDEQSKFVKEQWVKVACKSGKILYAKDKDLLKNPLVKEGVHTGYGKVSDKPKK